MLLLSRNQHEVRTEISQLVYTSIKETYKELPVAPTWAAEIIYLICYSTSSILISGETLETVQKLIRTWPEAAAWALAAACCWWQLNTIFFFVLHRCWKIFGLCCCVHRRVKISDITDKSNPLKYPANGGCGWQRNYGENLNQSAMLPSHVEAKVALRLTIGGLS